MQMSNDFETIQTHIALIDQAI